MTTIAELRTRIPELQGLDDDQALNVIHEAYYPSMDKAELGALIGVKAASAPDNTSALRRAGDVGISALKGAIEVPEAAIGVADLATNGYAGKYAEMAGFRPKEAKAVLDEQYSDAQKAADKEVADAKGFLPTVGAALQNPSFIVQNAVESAPSMLVGGVLSRGVMALAPRIGAVAAGAFGEGATAAGQNAEQVRQDSADGTLSPTQSAILAASGMLTGGIGLGAGKIANKLGIGDAATMLASGHLGPVGEEAIAEGAKKSMLRKIAEGAGVEGIGQELPQSYQEQVAQNLAQDKPWDEGAGAAGAQGMLAGGLMGGVAGPLHAQHEAGLEDINAHKVPDTGPLSRAANAGLDQKILQLAHDPDPLISFPDGSVGTKSAFEASLLNMTPEEQQAERRRVMGRDPETGKRIKVEEPPEPTAADSEKNSDANIKAWSSEHDPVTLDYAQNLLKTPGAKGLGLMIAPHASGEGYTVIPSKWMSLDAQAKAVALQNGDAARLPGPDSELPSGRMIVDSEGGAAPETYGDARRTAESRAKLESDAARREELGTPVPRGTKATIKEKVNGSDGLSNNARAAAGNAQDGRNQQGGTEEVAPGNADAAGIGSAAEQGGVDANAAVGADTVIYNPKGQPFVTEFSAKRKLKEAKLADTHEVAAVDGGYVVQPRQIEMQDEIDQAAHEAATSPNNGLQEPTPAQKEAGNYRKGHVDIHGMDISIENPVGSIRSGVDRSGKAWQNTMQHHYGYIRGTVGADKDHIDTFIGQNRKTDKVFVVDQIHPETGHFDEHKVMLGFGSLKAAKSAYQANYAKGWEGGKNVSETSLEGFKAWLKDGDTKKPFSEHSNTDKKAVPVNGLDEKNATPTPTERRQDTAARKAVGEMTPDELRHALLTDEMTGLGNRRAYNEVSKKPFQASIDVDALKWVNDNMGHESGDKLIELVGQALRDESADAYHLSGDEFVAQFDKADAGHELLGRVRSRLNGAVVDYTAPDGTVTTKTGVEFSYGLANNLESADAELRADKAIREARGERPSRGAEPSGVVKKPATGRQDHARNAAANAVEARQGDLFSESSEPETQKSEDEGKSELLGNSENTKPLRSRAYSHAEMLARGADGNLSKGYERYVPIDKLEGFEPTPTNNESDDGEYHAGHEITQPIEVKYDESTDSYMVYSGNHRIAQARANAQTYILAFVEPDRNSGRDFIGTSPETSNPDKNVLFNAMEKAPVTNFNRAIYDDIEAGHSSTDILKNIATGSFNPQYRELAQALIDAGVNPKIDKGSASEQTFVKKSLPAGMTFTAGYDPKTNTVLLFQPHDAERNVLHEMVHAATYNAVRGTGIAATQMRALYHHVNRSGEMAGMYGMENHDEFVAEALSNPEFQDKLRTITGMPTGSKFANAWQWFVDVVRRAIGLPAKIGTALDQALRLGRGMIQENGNPTASDDSMLAATGDKRDAMHFTDQWQTDSGHPIYYGKDWLLQPEKELDASADMQPNGLPLGQAAFVDADNKVYAYTVRDNSGKMMGKAVLQVDPRGNIVAIHDIETTIKGQGLGTKIVGTILASTKNPVRVIQMIPSAEKFWQGVGVYGQDTYDNGAIDWQSFTQSARGRAAGMAGQDVQERGTRPTAGSKSQSAESKLTGDMLANVGTVGGAYDMLRSSQTLSDVTEGMKSLLSSDRKFGLWDRTIGTQFNKSTKDADFKRVFDAYNQQTDDTAHYAIEAERFAPGVLQRLDSFKDITKALMNSGGKYKADIAAVSQALFDNIAGKRGVQQKVFTDAELRDDFKLTDPQILMYRQTRQAIDTSTDRLAQTTIASMGQAAGMDISTLKNLDLDATAKAVKDGTEDGMVGKNIAGMTKEEGLHDRIDELVQHANELKAAGYMPAMRFGEHAVTVTDPAKDGEPLHFEMFESQMAANVAANRLAKEYPGMQVQKSVMNPDQFAMFKGVSPETVELFAKFSGMDKNEAFKDYIALAKSNRSTMKRMLERKGIAGFSEDATRVLASFVTSNARQSALNMNGGEINAAMASPALAKKGDVQREAQKLHEYMSNPREEAQRLRGFLFMHFLGGSVASAITNLTQPVLQTTPYLSQYAGSKTPGIMASSAKMAATGKINDPTLRAAAERAAADGITDPHEIHNLMADASGSTLGSSLRARALTKAWGSFFSLSEAFNRRVTFLAAYQTAMSMGQKALEAKGFKDAYHFASNAIIETQGLYSKTNRPNWARGAVGSVLFTFKQFGISYIEMLNRLPPKQKLLALGILVLAAGAQGLPFADDIEDVIDTLGQTMGFNTNSKKALRLALAEAFGKDLGDILNTGISAKTGVDMSGRLGMSNLVPGTALFKMSEKDKSRDVAEFAGPVGSVLTSFQKAFAKVQAGNVLGKTGALSEMTPVAIKNALQGGEMATTGVYRDSKGRKVKDVDLMDSVIKGLGFQPEAIAAESRKISDAMQDKGMRDAVKDAIADRIVQGITENDQDAVAAARKTLADWNKNNPESRITVSPMEIRSRIAATKTTREQRFIKSQPKASRSAVRDDLRA